MRESLKESDRSFFLISGLVLILSLGFLDLLLGLLKFPEQFTGASATTMAIVLTILAALVLYSILWILLVRPVSKLLQLQKDPAALSLAVFIGICFVLAFLSNFQFEKTANSFLQYGLASTFCFFISVLTYVCFVTTLQMPRFRKWAATILQTLPFLLAEMLGVLLIRRIATGYSSTFLLLGSGLALLVLLFSTLWFFYHYGNRKTLAGGLTVLLILVLLSPLHALFSSDPKTRMREQWKPGNHSIRYVILLTIDTLRRDALRLYSNKGAPAPHIETLAKEAIIYRKAYSEGPWTLPSVASLLTGVSPLVHLAVTPKSRLPSVIPTLAEYMYKAGFYTGAIGSNAVLEDPAFSRGFIDYDFLPVGYYVEPEDQNMGMLLLKWIKRRQRSEDSTAEVTKMSREWLLKNRNKDFFLWIHYFDPHQPYSPPVRFIPDGTPPAEIGRSTSLELLSSINGGFFIPTLLERDWIQKLYLAEVQYVDEQIGSLIATLKETGIYRDSLIILTSDHGEEFWEHEKLGHGHTLYNELVSVPLMMKLPAPSSSGENESIVSIAQIMPTILRLCNIRYNPDLLTAVPLLHEDGSVLQNENAIISTGMYEFGKKISVTFGNTRYIKDLIANQHQLYDLNSDPDEQYPSIDSPVDSLQKALALLDAAEKNSQRLREHYKITTSEKSSLNEEMEERLRALGYVQ